MRPFLFAAIIAFSLAVGAAPAAPAAPLPAPNSLLPAHARVLVLGDSITQDGRYVSFLEYYLHQVAPAAQPDLISIGLSAETVSGLSEPGHPYPRPCVLERLDRALQAVKPQVVLACYGMNDGIYHPPAPERAAAFAAGLQRLIAQVRAAGARLVLITPPLFDPEPIRARTVPAGAPEFGYSHPFTGYDGVLADFGAAELALHESGVEVIDLHTPLAQALAARRQHESAFTFSPDGVHPADAGHLLIARTIAAGVGLALPAVPLDEELARVQTDPVFALIRERRSLRSEAWLAFVGYTREHTFRSASVEAAETVAARLQAQIDAAPKP